MIAFACGVLLGAVLGILGMGIWTEEKIFKEREASR